MWRKIAFWCLVVVAVVSVALSVPLVQRLAFALIVGPPPTIEIGGQLYGGFSFIGVAEAALGGFTLWLAVAAVGITALAAIFAFVVARAGCAAAAALGRSEYSTLVIVIIGAMAMFTVLYAATIMPNRLLTPSVVVSLVLYGVTTGGIGVITALKMR